MLEEEQKYVDGLIQAWLPGIEGANALTNIIFGKKNPSARLTQSFPYNEGQIPVYYNGFNTGRPENSVTHSGRFVSKYLDAPNLPLYSFDYGLSYHDTEYREMLKFQTYNNGFASERGEFEVMVGRNSNDVLISKFELVEKT